MDTIYIELTETAKLLRADLKKNFPGVKFSVRTKRYSMGQSICVHWTDGPTTAAVDAVSDGYQGQRFDGMDDSTHTVFALRDGKRVHYGANYVNTSRHLTNDHIETALQAMRLADPNYALAYVDARGVLQGLPAYDNYATYRLAHNMAGRNV